MYLSEMQTKDIISVTTGQNLGKIVDVEVSHDGKVVKFIAENKKIFRKMLSSSEITFAYSDITKIGTDCTLVNK